MGWRGRIIRLSVIMLVMAVAIFAGAIFGHRSGAIEFTQAFGGLALGALVSGAAGFIALIALVWTFFSERKGGLILVVLVLAVSLTLLGIPAYQAGKAYSGHYPPIHDVTTDTGNPPAFVDIVKIRGTSANSIDYASKAVPENVRFAAFGGRDYPSLQREYYPDVKPLTLDLEPEAVYWLALDIATANNWEIVASVPEDGRIEATATSKWMGFKDDVVIRLTSTTEDATSTKVDMRSSSRKGVSDIGANAARIEKFLTALKRRAGKEQTDG